MNHRYLAALLNRLAFEGGLPNLRNLTIWSAPNWNNPTETGEAIQNMLLNVSANLTEFTLMLLSPENEQLDQSATEIVFECIQHHPSIRKFTCLGSFPEEYPFPALVRNSNVLEDLSICHCYHMDSLCELLEELETNTVLKRFHVWVFESALDDFMANHQRLGGLVSRLSGLQILELSDESMPTFEEEDDENFGITKKIPKEFVEGFKKNTSLTKVKLRWIPDDSELGTTLQSYATRNYCSLLKVRRKPALIATFEALFQSREDTHAMSIAFDVLRGRNDWFD